MCIVTHVAQIITLYKIIHCVALHTLSGITQKVSTVKFLHRKVSIFCVHSGKIYTGQKKFTQAPPVVPVTNMRYAICFDELITDRIDHISTQNFAYNVRLIHCDKYILFKLRAKLKVQPSGINPSFFWTKDIKLSTKSCCSYLKFRF